MGRAKTQRKRAGRTASAEAKSGATRPADPITRKTGREERDAVTDSSSLPADPKARVIKTRS